MVMLSILRGGRTAALAAVLLLSAGCATKRDLRDLRTELQGLSVRQDSILRALARQNTVTQDTLRRQTDQMFEIRGELSRQLRQILDELASLRELTGQNQRTIASVRDQLEGLRRVGASGPTEPSENVVGSAAGGDAGNADAIYAAALQQHQRGSLTVAQRAFQDFVQQYGNHERAPDARFYLADILEQQDETQEAIEAFNQISELHPSSDRVPEALYRAALLNIELGRRDQARRLLDRVVNTYGDTDAAGLARAKLRELR